MENRNYGMEYRNYGMEYRNYGMEYRNYGMEYMEKNIWKDKSCLVYNLTKFMNFNKKITFYFYTIVNNNYEINLLNFKKLHQF